MTKSSKRWLQRHNRDLYVKRAHRDDYRSRAVYKLMEIDQRDGIFHPGQVVVDLGSAPGSWSQYASERIGTRGRVLAVDILPQEPLSNVLFIKGDFTDTEVYHQCLEQLPERGAELVISDMAPNLSGIRSTDQARAMHLAELVYEFSGQSLKAGGAMLVKLFQGQGTDEYIRGLRQRFRRVVVRKPRASRDKSREFYILAMGYVV